MCTGTTSFQTSNHPRARFILIYTVDFGNMIRCPTCGLEWSPSTLSCPKDGTRLTDPTSIGPAPVAMLSEPSAQRSGPKRALFPPEPRPRAAPPVQPLPGLAQQQKNPWGDEGSETIDPTQKRVSDTPLTQVGPLDSGGDPFIGSQLGEYRVL